ncbi:DUF6216 family protein [Massilia sp. CFBP9012]|uniref:DUF6216 family protein n=1 Tax=Massilia sp. CFBP9012 TaxID=3096531 RepID=UPI002A6A95B0|nr:DUF6216 family protein [Massilia sp. CFBP9012]MDY0973984.1 DUF6216 family protein [Massilia sp. CFBP9012]
MFTQQIFTTALPAFLQYLVAPTTLALFIILAFFYWRSGSSHPVILKIWLVMFGQSEVNSASIKKFSDDELDLMKFRYLTGIKAATLRRAERLIRWSTDNDIELRLIRNAGEYFDIEKPEPTDSLLNLVPGHVLWRMLPLALIAPFLIISLGTTQYNRAIIKVIATDKYFTIDREYATRPFDNKRIYLKDCSDLKYSEYIDKVSLNVLCEIGSSQAASNALADYIETQKQVALLASAYMLAVFLWLLKGIMRADAALKIRKALRSRQAAA